MMTRTSCVICGGTTFKPLTEWSRMPIFMGTTDQYTDQFAKQTYILCERCGCVQLKYLIWPNVLYQYSHQPGTVGKTWSDHHDAFATFILGQGVHRNYMEIGAGNLKLANCILSQEMLIENYYVQDPNVRENNTQFEKIKLLDGFFPDVKPIIPVDVLVHSHTMEHFYDVAAAMRAAADLLPNNGLMIFSVPVIDEFLKRGYTNGMNFEHTYLTTQANLRYVVERAGFFVVAEQWFSPLNIFIAARKAASAVTCNVPTQADRNERIFNDYIQILMQDVHRLNERMKATPHPVFIHGAHIFTQTLLQCGLDASRIAAVIDNDEKKWDKRLYGTPFMTRSPDVLKSVTSPSIIVRSAQYSDEIIRGLQPLNPALEIL